MIFNPNQLKDPQFDDAGKVVNEADNFAGTFLRSPKLNSNGQPTDSKGKILNTDNQIEKAYTSEINRYRNGIVKNTGEPKESIVPQKIGESSEWAESIAKHDKAIKNGLEKGVARIQAGEYAKTKPEVSAEYSPKPTATEPADMAAKSQDSKPIAVPTSETPSSKPIDSSPAPQSVGGNTPPDHSDTKASLGNGISPNATANNNVTEMQRGHLDVGNNSIDGNAARKPDPVQTLENQPSPNEGGTQTIKQGPEKVTTVAPANTVAANEPFPPPDNVTKMPGNQAASPAPPDSNLKINTPAAPEVVHARVGAGLGTTGVALGAVGLKNSIQEGDKAGIASAGLNVGAGALDVGLDAATALGKNAPTILRGVATKANIAATVVDGVYQISKEEGVDNKLARGTAVGITAGTGIGLGVAAAGVVTTGAAATVAVVAAPIVATVAVGMAADAAVGAYKATNELDESIKRSERAIKVRSDVEPSGAPKLSNYTHLRQFAVLEGAAPGGENVSGKEKSQLIANYEYSKDPAALKDLETRLQSKIDHYDKIIEKNDSWVHDSMRFFGQDEVDAKRMAQIDRAHYVAAMNELKLYKQELAGGAPQAAPPQGVKSYGTNISAVLPADATLTVQSSNNNASVVRNVAPDNQIKLMQADGQSSSTLADIERQRNMDAIRAAEQAATVGQPQQQTTSAQMGAR